MWKNSLYNTLGGLIRLGLGLISVPLLTRNLGVENYGLYTTASAIINIALFSEWTIAASITVYLSTSVLAKSSNDSPLEKKNNLSIAAIYVIILALFTTVLMYYSTPFLVLFFSNLDLAEKKILKDVVQIGSWIVCIRLIMQFFIGILQAYKAYGIINILSTFLTAISSLLTLYIAFTSKDIIMIQKLQLVTVVITLILYFAYCLYLGYLSRTFFVKPITNHFTNLSKYGVKTLITALGSTLFSQFDRLIMLRLFGVEWAGIYSAITTIANQINVVSSMPIQPLLPVFIESYQKLSNTKVMERIFVKAFEINAAIIFLSGSTIVIFSSELVNFLFKTSTVDIILIKECLIVITIAYSIYSFNAVGYFTLLATRNEQYVTNVVLISGALSLWAIYSLSAKFGILAGCFGNVGYSLTLFLFFKSTKKLDINNHKLLKIIFPFVITSVMIYCFSLFFNDFLVKLFLYLVLIIFLIYKVKYFVGLDNSELLK